MSEQILLVDTNAVVAYTDEENAAIIQLLDSVARASIHVPFAVVGELYSGAYLSAQTALNKERLEAFVDGRTILYPDMETTRLYGEVTTRQERKGQQIPQNDRWIAALAFQHDLTVVTRDKHFTYVDNLKRLSW
jgi:tRNA(fMet)-specific endonuclease VapC